MKFVRFLLRFLISLLIAIVLVALGLWISGNGHVIKAVRSTYLVGKTGPTIDDYPKFENRTVEAGAPQLWEFSKNFQSNSLGSKLIEEIESWETVALLVVHQDSIAYERYWNGYSEKSLTNTFSMAKSFTSLAIGKAIEEGHIKSIDQKVGDFLPEFTEGEKAKVTIKHLLQMASGIDFGESYGNPFGYMAKTYYGSDLYDLTVNKPLKYEPGTVWKYQGGNTLLLSFILEKATGQNLSDYFSQHFWKPLGAKEDALWSLNEAGGQERSYCCFYSNARDFARVGQMMLDSGKWNGRQLINQDYIEQSISPVNLKNEEGKLIDYYGLQWWMGAYQDDKFYYASGIQGQYIVAIPEWDAVVVRLGHKRDPNVGAEVPKDLFVYLKAAEAISSINQASIAE
jgi:CubicO group peptidase (beta-lactamase class C family)